MAAIVSDTSPLNYLVLINAIEFLPSLFSEVFIPPAVANELSRERTPKVVREWFAQTPTWLKKQAPINTSGIVELDPGETEAISLAHELGIRDLLLDDGAARQVARKRGFEVFGTLGILVEASRRRWIDFDEYVQRLQATSFHANDELFNRARLRATSKLI